ncbi:MAG: SMP-30/gluconolactonase/LRE family protein [archaeon]|nr:SMP-30/gluconolactonase/LRE family protein [archaeon]
MSSMNGVVIKSADNVKQVFKMDIPTIFYHPRMDKAGNFYVCSQMGEIIKFNDSSNKVNRSKDERDEEKRTIESKENETEEISTGTYEIFKTSLGQPLCIVFADSDDGSFCNENEAENKTEKNLKSDYENSQDYQNKENSMEEQGAEEGKKVQQTGFYADLAESMIKIIWQSGKGEEDTLAKDINGIPLRGPTSIAMSKLDAAYLFFCDGGYFESTSLSRPKGSVYRVELNSGHELEPVIKDCLAYPSDIIFSQNTNVGYVAETFANRIIRIINTEERDKCYVSVFYTFQGRVGPTALAMDDLENVYVARYEYQNEAKDVNGIIDVITKDGNLIGELIVPKNPEITGMLIYEEEPKEGNRNRKNMYLYFTEKNFSGVRRIRIGNFVNDIERMMDRLY